MPVPSGPRRPYDTHLHHARAVPAAREARGYRAELAWNHPDVNPDVAELAVAGFDSSLYYNWPMVRSLVESSRLVAVHGEGARAQLLDRLPLDPARGGPDRIVSVRLGEGQTLTEDQERAARQRVRAHYGIADDAVVFGCFGGLTPEKRVPQILAAMRAIAPGVPAARLLLAGAPAAHYDVAADVAAHGLQDVVTLTGYLDSDADLTDLQWVERGWRGAQAYADSKLLDTVLAFGVSRRWPGVRSNSVDALLLPPLIRGRRKQALGLALASEERDLSARP
jgi:glycosyltransferase involved in cell wall biosynthesis